MASGPFEGPWRSLLPICGRSGSSAAKTTESIAKHRVPLLVIHTDSPAPGESAFKKVSRAQIPRDRPRHEMRRRIRCGSGNQALASSQEIDLEGFLQASRYGQRAIISTAERAVEL